MPAIDRQAVSFGGLRMPAQARIGFSQIVFGNLLAGFGARRQFQPRYGFRGVAGSQQVDAQQEIRKIVAWLQPSCALQYRDSLSKMRLLVQLEPTLEKGLEVVVLRALGHRWSAHANSEKCGGQQPSSELAAGRHASATIAPRRVGLQT